MNNEIQSLLKSPLPADRKRGLQMLAKSDDPQALKVLSALHKRETDPELKQLIVQVGKTVKQRVDAAGSSAPMKAAASDSSNQASQMMEQAQQALIELDFDNAKALARRAFTLNPDLQDDDEARNLAGDIFGTSADEAVAILMGKQPAKSNKSAASGDVLDWVDSVSNSNADKPKRKTKTKVDVDDSEVTWGTALMDVGLYGLITGGLVFLALLFFLKDLGSFGLGFSAMYGVAIAIGTMVGMMIWYGAIHFAATTFLSGSGTYPALLHRVFLPMVIWLIISGVLTVIGFMMVGEAAFDPTMASNPQQLEALGPFNLIQLVGSIIFTVWLSNIIGDNYHFGGTKGCISIVLGYIVLAVLACGCVFVFSSMFAGALSSFSDYPSGIILLGLGY